MNNQERAPEWPTYDHIDHILARQLEQQQQQRRDDEQEESEERVETTTATSSTSILAVNRQFQSGNKLIQVYSNERGEVHKTGPLMNMFHRVQAIEEEKQRRMRE